MKHSLERTSPFKTPFVGTCVLCGKKNVTSKQFFNEECLNVRGLTEEEAIVEAIIGPEKTP